jgi:hypothetical protein
VEVREQIHALKSLRSQNTHIIDSAHGTALPRSQ